jgi:type IV pilus assembly protein PilO
MKDTNVVRQRIVVALVLLALVNLAALTYLILPSRTDMSAQREALNDAQQEAHRLTQTVMPLQHIGAKLKKADADINDFYKNRLASRYSEVVDEIGKVASNSRVTLGGVTYKQTPTTLPDLQSLEMQAEVSGSYADLAKFVNGLERNKIFFIIDSVSLSGQKEGTVRLNLKFETYLRMKTEES